MGRVKVGLPWGAPDGGRGISGVGGGGTTRPGAGAGHLFCRLRPGKLVSPGGGGGGAGELRSGDSSPPGWWWGALGMERTPPRGADEGYGQAPPDPGGLRDPLSTPRRGGAWRSGLGGDSPPPGQRPGGHGADPRRQREFGGVGGNGDHLGIPRGIHLTAGTLTLDAGMVRSTRDGLVQRRGEERQSSTNSVVAKSYTPGRGPSGRGTSLRRASWTSKPPQASAWQTSGTVHHP